ncbi:hypothetical protein EVAR_22933_1 [Eumeta japonica]|uniref:Uncharacterized protein n=1 Tax=Eumeta variegata TaxID=151549 RepID=A0A4C1UU81_EUMVA|nr:hypothetical protein EVAR_22933_1 [Eumeta japonica]
MQSAVYTRPVSAMARVAPIVGSSLSRRSFRVRVASRTYLDAPWICFEFRHRLLQCECLLLHHVVCGRCLSSTRTQRPMKCKKDRSFRVLSLACSAQAERENESCFSCVQPTFIDL